MLRSRRFVASGSRVLDYGRDVRRVGLRAGRLKSLGVLRLLMAAYCVLQSKQP
ncbi:hypothetical protein DEO72_LG5g889 [Vigna unguiculata]|uniref:Uncharacterized protein n=1 Tax=Vigna unguiculata TaxID=3917 RepID=A0A4D6LWG8_VIGUN|nr:hypothetical protein DEO72_LG5g889 [Vigna unguiculata]